MSEEKLREIIKDREAQLERIWKACVNTGVRTEFPSRTDVIVAHILKLNSVQHALRHYYQAETALKAAVDKD